MKLLRNNYKKAVSVLLSAALIMGLFTIVPFTANAADTTEKISGTYTVPENGYTFDNRVVCDGDVTIVLTEGATLNISKGISVTDGASLTIEGKGSLIIDNVDDNNAGIGGDEDESLSSLTVNGGNILVKGGENAAGIGGGKNGFVGKVTINGGSVTATGGNYGAGIGTGYLLEENGDDASEDAIQIKGGVVTATGGTDAGGIGEGSYQVQTDGAETAAITIEGGTVNAYSDRNSDQRDVPSIGGSGCTVSVLGGNVRAENGGIYAGSGESIVLSWKKVTDSIYSFVYNGSGNVTFQKRFKIQNTDTVIEPGDYPEENAVFVDKTLIPPYDGFIDNVSYIDENGTQQTASKAVALNDSMTELPSGWYVANVDSDSSDTTYENRIVCDGDVNLILCDYCILNLRSGITVAEGSSLTIYAQSGYDPNDGNSILGKMLCGNGGVDGNSSIGGESGQNSGDITIVGGSITAVGAGYGAGIGGGNNGNGTVTVNCSEDYPAYVNATGGNYAAGIGGGQNGSGTVKIYGGYVTANGNSRSAGIGGGRNGDGSIEIYNGNISATGGNYAASIGGGEEGAGNVTINGGTVGASNNTIGGGAAIGGGNNKNGIVNISGGNVTATTDSNGAGIGGGRGGVDSLVTISGGEVHAVSNDAAAAIGGGFKTKGTVIINGGTVTASVSSSDTYGPAGIGGGSGDGGIGEVTITDGTVSATGGRGGAGIGGGRACSGNVIISGGTVTKAIGNDGGAGIGGGSDGAGTVNISGGTITEAKSSTTNNNGAAGIGGGVGGTGSVTISDGTVTSAVGGTYGAGIGGGNEASGEIEISGGDITAHGGYNAAGIGGGKEAAGTVTVSGGNISATGGYLASGIGNGYNSSNDSEISLSWTNLNDSIYSSSYGGSVTLEKSFKNKDNASEVFTPGAASATDLADKTIVPYIAYTVTWKNYDDSPLKTESVGLGESPVYDGETPEKPGSDGVRYIFKGWTDSTTSYAASDTLPAVTGDITYTAEFTEVEYAAQVEPYIDENGAYILGVKEHYVIGGKNYAVNADGSAGNELPSVELSYFDFGLINNNTEYRINYYTGPTENLSELVIPKTFSGKKITVLGSDAQDTLINYDGKTKTQFELKLNENIKEIKKYTFYTIWVTKVSGDTPNLSMIGDYAFSWANSPGGYTLDIQLDYPGRIGTGLSVFNNMNVTLRLKHATTFSNSSFNAQSVSYVFTDNHRYGDPEWTWADDHSTATAKFTCTNSRCGHKETVVDTDIDVEETDEKIIYTASVEFEGKTYTNQKEVQNEIGSWLVGHSLSLDGDIGVNFYMYLSEEIANSSTAYMEFHIPAVRPENQLTTRVYVNKQQDPSLPCAYTKIVDNKTYYVFKCRVAAKEMTSDITAQIKDDESDKTGTVYHYCVKDYSDYLLNNAYEADGTTVKNKTFADAVPLVKKLINYGAYAQRYFDRNSEDLANADLNDKDRQLADVTAAMIERKTYTKNLDESVTYDGATLSLKSETSLSLYFISESEGLTFSCIKDNEEMTVQVEHTGTQYIARIRGIAANKLNDEFTLKVMNGETELGSVTYSPMKYCYNTLYRAETIKGYQEANIDFVNVVKALYWYYDAAKAYFTPKS